MDNVGLLAVVLLSILAPVIGVMRHKRQEIRWLKQYGLRVIMRTTRTEIRKDLVTETLCYRVIAQWDDPVTNQTYIFSSKLLWSPPHSGLLGSEHMVSVLIDPNNPHRYLMESSW